MAGGTSQYLIEFKAPLSEIYENNWNLTETIAEAITRYIVDAKRGYVHSHLLNVAYRPWYTYCINEYMKRNTDSTFGTNSSYEYSASLEALQEHGLLLNKVTFNFETKLGLYAHCKNRRAPGSISPWTLPTAVQLSTILSNELETALGYWTSSMDGATYVVDNNNGLVC